MTCLVAKYDGQAPKRTIVRSLDYYKIIRNRPVLDHQVSINFHMNKIVDHVMNKSDHRNILDQLVGFLLSAICPWVVGARLCIGVLRLNSYDDPLFLQGMHIDVSISESPSLKEDTCVSKNHGDIGKKITYIAPA